MPYTKTFYQFSELTKEQQKDFVELNPEKFNPGHGWWESTLEHLTEILEQVGFWNVNIYFSGFGSQGDGAQFVGCYEYNKGGIEKVLEEYKEYSELMEFCNELLRLGEELPSLRLTIGSKNNYWNESCTQFAFSYQDTYCELVEDGYKEACRAFMQEIYSRLEKEYDYLNSVEYILECSESYDHLEIGESDLDLIL